MSEMWFDQRYDDALFADREARGLCGNCGRPLGDAQDSADHACPPAEEADR